MIKTACAAHQRELIILRVCTPTECEKHKQNTSSAAHISNHTSPPCLRADTRSWFTSSWERDRALLPESTKNAPSIDRAYSWADAPRACQHSPRHFRRYSRTNFLLRPNGKCGNRNRMSVFALPGGFL